MRVDRDGVGLLDAGEDRPTPLGELEEPAVGGIEMEPQPFPRRDPGQFGERIDGPGVGGAGRADHEERLEPAPTVLMDGSSERSGIHTESGIDGDRPGLVTPESRAALYSIPVPT